MESTAESQKFPIFIEEEHPTEESGQSTSNVVANEPKAVPNPPRRPEENEVVDDIIPRMQNVISTAYLGTRLDLRLIATQARDAEYNPERFAAVIMKLREPKTTALIFATGKMVCTGANSVEQSHKAARKFARIIQKMDFDVKFSRFQVRSLVASCTLPFSIRLEELVADYRLFARYDPEQFPGVVYRMDDPKAVVLIFRSGKLVITEVESEEDLVRVQRVMRPLLAGYEKEEEQ